MIDNLDFSQDFFELYPDFKLHFPTQSSQRLWSYVYYVHPKSIYSNLLFRDKVPLLQEMLDSTLDPGDSGQAMDIELVANLVLTKKRRLLYSWEKKLEEREDFLAAIPYGVDSYEMLDKMMGGTDKMYKQYLSMLSAVEGEESSTFGGEMESLAESGVI